jgi:hypothetical protein
MHEALADSTLADESHQNHLHESVVSVGEAQTTREPDVVVGPQLDDTVLGACDADRGSRDLDITPLAGDSHLLPR